MRINLDRFLHDPSGTLGILTCNGRCLAFTLEPPMDAGKHGPIPAGSYQIRWRMVGRIARMYQKRGFQGSLEIGGVPGRTAIEIHAGNTATDTSGCVLVGLSVENVRGHPLALQRSRAAAEGVYGDIDQHLRHGDVSLSVMDVC